MRKTCARCGQSKLLVDFYAKTWHDQYPNSAAGVSFQCKECDKQTRREYVGANKGKCKKSDRKYHLSKYDLTPEDYDNMLTAQKGCCLGCGKHQTEFKKNLVVDHCHKSSKVRGLLCWQCNSGLGCLKDNVNTLLNLIQYLKNSSLVEEQTNVVSITAAKKVG